MNNIIADKIIEGSPSFLVFFDNVRVDQYINSFSVDMFIDGTMSTASIDMIYVPDFYQVSKRIPTTAPKIKLTNAAMKHKVTANTSTWGSKLCKGMKGSSVKDLQQFLNNFGYGTKWVGGTFDSSTESAVKSFQKNYHLTVDGVVGKKTMAVIKEVCNRSAASTLSPSTIEKAAVDSAQTSQDGVENMTNVRIFVKNMFNNKYFIVFDGVLKGKTLSKDSSGYSLNFSAVDYVSWLTKTVVPIGIAQASTLTMGDQIKWQGQGIDIAKVNKINMAKDATFKGKTLSEMWVQIVNETLTSNSLYNTQDSVSLFDNVLSRICLMGDINETLRKEEVVDFLVTNSMTSMDSAYVLVNDLVKSLLFEFYQDRDGVIRIKPPFWNEPVLKSFIIDPSLILNYTGSTNWNNYYTRVISTGGLEACEENSTDITKSAITPVAVATISGDYAVSNVTSSSSSIVQSNSIVEYAKSFIGVTKYPSNSDYSDVHAPEVMDCSKFVQYVYANFGVLLERDSRSQSQQGIKVDASELQPGDLIFYYGKSEDTKNTIHHVAMYIGNNQMIESMPSTNVAITTMRTNHLAWFRRVSADVSKFNSSSVKYAQVTSSQLLQPNTFETKYGPCIYKSEQPMIKFSTASAVSNANDAYEALKQYSFFMLGLLNSTVETARVQTIAMPWLRPGFNVWLDPIGIDKVYYVNTISHQGSAQSGVFTSLGLSLGRTSTEFSKGSSPMGALRAGTSDNIFINKMIMKADDFGDILPNASSFDKLRTQCLNFYTTTGDEKNMHIIKADSTSSRNNYFKNLYASPNSFKKPPLKNPAASTAKSSVVSIDTGKWAKMMKSGAHDTAKDKSVSELQRFLVFIGSNPGTIDGKFGLKTTAALKDFQRRYSLAQSGYVSEPTRQLIQQKINEEKAKNNKSEALFDKSTPATIFDGQYNVNDIIKILNNLYVKSSTTPKVVKSRALRLKNIATKAADYMKSIYVSENNVKWGE